jgi:hypothetical protein
VTVRPALRTGHRVRCPLSFAGVAPAAFYVAIAFAGIASLLTVIAMGLAAWWLLGRGEWRGPALFPVASFVLARDARRGGPENLAGRP